MSSSKGTENSVSRSGKPVGGSGSRETVRNSSSGSTPGAQFARSPQTPAGVPGKSRPSGSRDGTAPKAAASSNGSPSSTSASSAHRTGAGENARNRVYWAETVVFLCRRVERTLGPLSVRKYSMGSTLTRFGIPFGIAASLLSMIAGAATEIIANGGVSGAVSSIFGLGMMGGAVGTLAGWFYAKAGFETARSIRELLEISGFVQPSLHHDARSEIYDAIVEDQTNRVVGSSRGTSRSRSVDGSDLEIPYVMRDRALLVLDEPNRFNRIKRLLEKAEQDPVTKRDLWRALADPTARGLCADVKALIDLARWIASDKLAEVRLGEFDLKSYRGIQPLVQSVAKNILGRKQP